MKTPFMHLAPTPFKGTEYGKNTGEWNGYINLPEGHRWYGLHYDDIPVSVHGGLTYSCQKGEYWCIGFDTCHSGDTPERWGFSQVHAETVRLLEQCL